MTVQELITELEKYPANMPVKILHNTSTNNEIPVAFLEENILETSTGAYVDNTAPESEWDNEDGKVTHAGEMFLLINPIIV